MNERGAHGQHPSHSREDRRELVLVGPVEPEGAVGQGEDLAVGRGGRTLVRNREVRFGRRVECCDDGIGDRIRDPELDLHRRGPAEKRKAALVPRQGLSGQVREAIVRPR